MPFLFVHLFTPHHTNNHRARVLHIDFLALYVLIIALFTVALHFFHSSYPDVLGYATDIRLDALLVSTNAKRAESGLPSLRLNQQLSAAAAGKAQDMLSKNYWAHISPDNKTPWDFIVGAGYKYSVAGENLAKNFSTSDAVVDAWMNSPSHKDNLLKASYQEVGFAIVNGTLAGEETTLVVQMFGAPSGQVAVAPKPVIPQVQAQQPSGTPKPIVSVTQTPAPSHTPIPSPIPSFPLAIDTGASVAAVVRPNQDIWPLNFASVQIAPQFDIPTTVRMVTMVFVGMFLTVMAFDAWIVSKRKIVRVSGHSLAHTLFFGVLVFILIHSLQGSIL